MKTLIDSEDFTYSEKSFQTEADAAVKDDSEVIVYWKVYTEGYESFSVNNIQVHKQTVRNINKQAYGYAEHCK